MHFCIRFVGCMFAQRTQSLDYSKKKWYIYSGILGRLSELVQLTAALAPPNWFFPIIVP